MASFWRNAYDVFRLAGYFLIVVPLYALFFCGYLAFMALCYYIPWLGERYPPTFLCGTMKYRRRNERQQEARRRENFCPLPVEPPSLSSSTRNADAPARSQKSSLFFSFLPHEIRHQILAAAFGHRTIHMDVFDGPKRRRFDFDPDKPVRAAGHLYPWGWDIEPGAVPHNGFWVEDKKVKRGWHWDSSVCHRNPPFEDSLTHRAWSSSWRTPGEDECGNGTKSCCAAWPGEWPQKCGTGALRWLMSCRQAYIEGIDVLYGTNTFHLNDGGALLSFHLHRFIQPTLRARMSRFEFVLMTHMSSGNLVASTGLAHVYQILEGCDRVSRLHITFRMIADDVQITPILKEMDDIMKALTGLEGVVLEFSPAVIEKLRSSSNQVETRDLPHYEARGTHQLWRCLDDGTGDARIERGLCMYPEHVTPSKTSASSNRERNRGYWLIGSPSRDESILGNDILVSNSLEL